MPESVVNIKDRVEHYKNLIQKKEELNKEFENWLALYQEMAGVLRSVRAVYEVERTPEAQAELDAWLKEEKDYLEIINEYADKFKEINEELSSFDAPTVEAQADYLANVTRFQELSNSMKEIEKQSKQMVGKPEATFVMVPNAEGRDKKVLASLAEQYMILSNEKRDLAKVIRKQYNSVINNIQEPEVVEETIEASVVDDYSEFDFENLSLEDKIKELEARMERMTKASGRKQRIKYNGEMVELPRVYVGQYLVCGSEIARLKKQIEGAYDNDDSLNNLANTVVFEPQKSKPEPVVQTEEVSTSVNLPSDEELLEKVYGSEEHKFALETTSLFKLVNAGYEKTKEIFTPKASEDKKTAKTKPKGFMKILNIKKPSVKKKIKTAIKKAGCVIVAGVMVMACAVPAIVGLIKKPNKNDNEVPDLTTPPTISGEMLETQSQDNELDYIIEETTTEEQSTEKEEVELDEEQETTHFALGEGIVISESAKIHNNMYDATLNRNGLKPYYGNEMAKSVGGVAVNYEGQLYFFYANDATAQENVDKLLVNGGEITAILAMNEHGYEGFYNVADVQSLNQSLGGMSR